MIRHDILRITVRFRTSPLVTCVNRLGMTLLYYIIMLALFVKVSTMYRPQLFVYERSAILSRSRNILRIVVLLRASAYVCWWYAPWLVRWRRSYWKYSINCSTISMHNVIAETRLVIVTRKPSWRKGKRATAVRVWRPLAKKSTANLQLMVNSNRGRITYGFRIAGYFRV